MEPRGPLDEISPTKIECYDSKTTWGCPTRFYLKYVLKRDEPKTAALLGGEQMHKQIEHYGKTGEDVLGPIPRAGKHLIEALRPFAVAYESPVPPFALEGIPISAMSKIDLRLPWGVIDWKSTSSIESYAKTPAELRRNTQVLIYLKACETNKLIKPNSNGLYEGSHVYFQTKGRHLAEKREMFLTPEQLESGIQNVNAMVREMKDVVKEQDVKKVKPNLQACDVGRGCPHRHYCPHKGGKEDIMASLMAKFAASTPTPAPAPATQTVDSTAKAVPPDAPKSDPAKAAEPLPPLVNGVPAPLTQAAPEAPAAEAPKKGPGRPRKKIEIKDESTGPDAPKTEEKPTAPAPANYPEGVTNTKTAKVAHPEVQVSHITVRHGLTLNMGNYQSAKVEVEMSGTFSNCTPEQAKAMLGGRVYAAAMEEAQKYQAGTEKK